MILLPRQVSVWPVLFPPPQHGRDSVATRYGLGGPGIESRWGRDFLHLSRLALRNTQLPVQWVPSKAAGAWRWPPTPSSADVKGRVKLYLFSPSGPSWPLLVWTYLYLYMAGGYLRLTVQPVTVSHLTPRQKRDAPYDAYLSSSVFIPRWWYRTVYSNRFMASPVCSLVPIALSVVFDYVQVSIGCPACKRCIKKFSSEFTRIILM